jgi:predicted ATPase/DNA-binding CsgD family transcriptional regulator
MQMHLKVDMPADRSNAAPRACLPAQPVPLIGRTRELLVARQLLSRPDVRLLTLTGAAGAGKTRLAVAVATEVLPALGGTALFVDLAPVNEAALVMPAITRTLGVPDDGQVPALERLQTALARKRALLVLDNFEQVLPAASHLAELLAVCPDLKLLVTSRAALRLRWEHILEVPPLMLPDLRQLPPLDVLAQMPAVALFVQRARAADAGFRLHAQNARAVAELCVRLDGLPLAIELAAARSRALPPQAMLARLEHQLDLLTTGAPDLPPRHRTLRAALAWSYDLLSPVQQRVFRRLAVFAGGATLCAAEAVCADVDPTTHAQAAGPAIWDALAALVDMSLVRREPQTDGEARFHMLETTRAYALERLVECGEAELVRGQHALFFTALAEEAQAALHNAAQIRWLDLLASEYSNLRAALAWSQEATDESGSGTPAAIGVRLAAALGWFWFLRGDRREGRAWLERCAERASGVAAARSACARALSSAAVLAQYDNDYAAAERLLEQALALGQKLGDEAVFACSLSRCGSLALAGGDFARATMLAVAGLQHARSLGDCWSTAFALHVLGLVERTVGRVTQARELLTESLALFRALGDRWGTAASLQGLGQLALHEGDYAQANVLWEERLTLSRELGNTMAVAHTLDLLSTVARLQGRHEQAAALVEEALAIRRETGGWERLAWTLHGKGDIALAQGDFATARECYRESLLLRSRAESRPGIAASLDAFARLAAAQGQAQRALKLVGAAAALHEATGPSLEAQHYSYAVLPQGPRPTDPLVEQAGQHLSAQAQNAAQASGRALSLEQAIAYALAGDEAASGRPPAWPAMAGTSGVLTPREREVAVLVAQGLTNRQIAEALVISEGTARIHIEHILNKLDFHSRAQIAAWVVAQRLHTPSRR